MGEGRPPLVRRCTLNVEKTEFAQARDYHRHAANWLMFAVLSTALAACCALVYLFYLAEKTQNCSMAGVVVTLTGRGAFVVLAGWILTFLGRLHSSHAQQAIFYQDRLAGIDAAKTLMPFADPGGRQDMVKQLVQAYMTLERNAFVATTRATARGLLISRRDVKAVTDLVQAVTEPAKSK